MAYSQRIAAAILVAVFGPATRAAVLSNLPVNLRFETRDFSGWSVGSSSPQIGIATDGTLEA